MHRLLHDLPGRSVVGLDRRVLRRIGCHDLVVEVEDESERRRRWRQLQQSPRTAGRQRWDFAAAAEAVPVHVAGRPVAAGKAPEGDEGAAHRRPSGGHEGVAGVLPNDAGAVERRRPPQLGTAWGGKVHRHGPGEVLVPHGPSDAVRQELPLPVRVGGGAQRPVPRSHPGRSAVAPAGEGQQEERSGGEAVPEGVLLVRRRGQEHPLLADFRRAAGRRAIGWRVTLGGSFSLLSARRRSQFSCGDSSNTSIVSFISFSMQ